MLAWSNCVKQSPLELTNLSVKYRCSTRNGLWTDIWNRRWNWNPSFCYCFCKFFCVDSRSNFYLFLTFFQFLWFSSDHMTITVGFKQDVYFFPQYSWLNLTASIVILLGEQRPTVHFRKSDILRPIQASYVALKALNVFSIAFSVTKSERLDFNRSSEVFRIS